MPQRDNIDLVIFDCDGVLVDSERLTIGVEARVLTEMGWEITVPEVVERFMGRSNERVIELVAEKIGRAAAEEFDRVTTDEVIAAFQERLQAIDGVEGVIERLHDAGLTTCVASSGSHRKMKLTLGITGLYNTFDGRIFSASEVEHGKPAPDLFLHAAARMGVAPERAVVIEDSVSGVLAAVAAGMRCFGFAGGLTPTTNLQSAGATTFDQMSELDDLIINHSSV